MRLQANFGRSLGIAVALFDDDERLLSVNKTSPDTVVWPFEITIPAYQYMILAICDSSGTWDTEDQLEAIDLSLYVGNEPPREANDGEMTDAGIVTSPPPNETPPPGCKCETYPERGVLLGTSLLGSNCSENLKGRFLRG